MKKKEFNKKLILLMVTVLTLTSALPVFASENVDIIATQGQMDLPVTIRGTSTYEVSVPKTITLIKGTKDYFPIKVKGDICSDEELVISTSQDMEMTQSASTKENVTVSTNPEKSTYSIDDIAGDGYESKVNVDTSALSAGEWKGNCTINVTLNTIETP